MKKILLIIASLVFFASCGVGTYSHSSGVDDKAGIVVVSSSQQTIEVYVDGAMHKVKSVKESNFKSKKNINKRAQNTVPVTPGQHTVEVVVDGQKVYSKKMYVSNSETKVINL